MAINLLKHYAMNASPSIYDEEALTALELAGRTAAKVNEAVDEFNKLEDETHSAIETQNQKLLESLGRIPTLVENAVNADVDRHIREGDFDNQIDNYLGDLEHRVDDLLGSVTVGSTTMDAEVIDVRRGGDGQSYANAGNATRAVYDNVHALGELLKSGHNNGAFKFFIDKLNPSIISGRYINASGEFVMGAAQQYKSAEVNVNELTFYMIYASAHFGNAIFSVLDKDKNVIDVITAKDSATHYCDFYFTPKNAAYLRFGYNSNFNYEIDGVIGKAVYIGRNNTTEAINEIIDLLNSGLNNMFNVGGVKLTPSTIHNEYVLDDVGILTPITDSTLNGYRVAEVDIGAGRFYRIKSSMNYENAVYSFVDTFGNVLKYGGEFEGSSTYFEFDEIVVAPATATKLYYSYNANVMTGEVSTVKSITPVTNSYWKNKTWCAVGDSLTEVNARTSKNYVDYIAEETGINTEKVALSGTGYARGYVANSAFYQRLTLIPNDVDVVTFFGSFNDLSAGLPLGNITDTGTTSICGCINTTFDTLFSKIPLARVGVITPTPWATSNEGNDTTNDEAYVDALINICKRRGIPCLDLYRSSGLRPWDSAFRAAAYSKDDGNGTHPDENGHAIIAPQIREFIARLI